MLLLGIKNTASQSVATDELINIGSVYRKYLKKINGLATFTSTSESVNLNHSGIYHLTFTAVGTGNVAGDVSIQLLENGEAIEGAISTQTITTATTEQRTFIIDYYILVNSSCILNTLTTISKSLSFINTGVEATFTSVVLNVEKL